MRSTLSDPRSGFAAPLCVTLSDPRSLSEALRGRLIVVGVQQEMFVGGLASQRVDPNLFLRQIDIGADQAVDPERAGFEGSSQHLDLALGGSRSFCVSQGFTGF